MVQPGETDEFTFFISFVGSNQVHSFHQIAAYKRIIHFIKVTMPYHVQVVLIHSSVFSAIVPEEVVP